jgi:hypothetical protein
LASLEDAFRLHPIFKTDRIPHSYIAVYLVELAENSEAMDGPKLVSQFRFLGKVEGIAR